MIIAICKISSNLLDKTAKLVGRTPAVESWLDPLPCSRVNPRTVWRCERWIRKGWVGDKLCGRRLCKIVNDHFCIIDDVGICQCSRQCKTGCCYTAGLKTIIGISAWRFLNLHTSNSKKYSCRRCRKWLEKGHRKCSCLVNRRRNFQVEPS